MLLFSSIVEFYLFIHIAAAVLPAIALLIYVYKQDKVESEPMPLIGSLILRGVAAALVAMVLEMIGEPLLGSLVKPNTNLYYILLAFFVVAVAEEGSKFFFLYRRTWNDYNFNYRFDGIVYAVSVSLGFAAFENLEYVFGYGLAVAPSRALLAIPGHLSFAVLMGLFYGRARRYKNIGKDFACRTCNVLAFLSAVFFHGFYDSCAMISSSQSTIVFVIFIAIMYLVVFRLTGREARNDRPL